MSERIEQNQNVVRGNAEGRSKEAVLLLFLVFCSSAAIMVMQLLGSRLSAPYVGQSLYTWTALIAITLLGIALGNITGGALADRFGTRVLPVFFALAAVTPTLIPAIRSVVGEMLRPVGLPWSVHIVMHTLLSYLPAFTALGMISPAVTYALVSRSPSRQGMLLGLYFATSLAGSLLGTIITAYYLIPHYPTSTLIYAAAGVFVVLSCVSFYFLRHTPAENAAPAAGSRSSQGGSLHLNLLRHIRRPLALSFLCGFGIMVIELAGARFLARHYGSSLYTWSTLIAMVIAGLSLGGYLGGFAARYWADRPATSRLFLLAAAFVMAAPLLSTLVRISESISRLPWVWQIIMYLGALVGGASLAFGAVQPNLTRWALRLSAERGHTLGWVYGANAVGSIAGTLLCGFWAVDYLGSMVTFVAVGVLAALCGFIASPRPRYAALAMAFCVFLFLSALPIRFLEPVGISLAFRYPADPLVVYEDESAYFYVRVQSMDPERPLLRSFIQDKLMHSLADLQTPEFLRYSYEAIYGEVTEKIAPRPQPIRALLLGGGGFVFPRFLYLTRPQSDITVVEIDPAVTRAAQKAFGLPLDAPISIIHDDARAFIEKALRKNNGSPLYDAIYLDCINDYAVPFHLTTREYFQGLAQRLAPSGLLMVNLMDVYESGLFLGAMIATLRSVFPYVAVFSCGKHPEQRDTFVILAGRTPYDVSDVAPRLRETIAFGGQLLADSDIENLLNRAGAFVLTDDYVPTDNLLAPVVTKTESTHLLARILRADTLLASGDIERSLAIIRDVLNQNPNMIEALVVLGNAERDRANYQEATAAYEKAIELDPSNILARHQLATLLYKLGHIERAIAEWRITLRIDPTHPQAMTALGIALYKRGEKAEGEKLLRRAMSLQPPHAPAYASLASLFYDDHHLSEAAAVLEQAMQTYPDHPEFLEQRAIVAWRQGDREKAKACILALDNLGKPVSAQLRQEIFSPATATPPSE